MTPDLRSQPKRETSPAVIVAATVLVCAPLVVITAFISHIRIDEIDKWLFAFYGHRMLEGAVLYADVWDNKPPGIFWINALGLWLGGGSPTGVDVLCTLAVIAAAVVYFVASQRLYGWPVAGIGTCLAVLYLNDWRFHVGCNRPNTFFVVSELACFAFYCRALTSARTAGRGLLLAGIFGGMGVCLKQSALAMSGAAFAHLALLAVIGQTPWRQTLHRAGWFAAGWLITVSTVTLALVATSQPGWAWNAVVAFNRLYFSPGSGSAIVPHFAWIDEHRRGLGLPLVLAGATLLHALFALRRSPERIPSPQAATQPPALLALLWLWMLAGVYLAAVGPHQRAPYLAVALPPLVSLTAYAVHLLVSSSRLVGRVPAFHVLVGVVWMVYMIVPTLHGLIDMAGRQYHHAYNAPPDLIQQRYVNAVAANAKPDEAIFIFGYDPELYWQSGRANAIRYIGTEKVDQLAENGQPLFDEIVADLKQARPKLILLDAPNVAKSPTVRRLDVTEFQRWLVAEYEQPDAESLPLLWKLR